MSLLNGRLSLHDVANVEAFVRAALDDRLRLWGAHLRPHDYEEALTELLTVCWELSRRYDPAKSEQSFSTYAGRILRLRVADFYRKRFGDRRYGRGAEDRVSLDERAEKHRLERADGAGQEDPTLDRSPDLAGVLGGRAGDRVRDIASLCQPAPRRARRENRGAGALPEAA